MRHRLAAPLLLLFLLLGAAPTAAAGNYVFARGVDNALWYHDGTRWQSLGGEIASAPDAAASGERIDVFARGRDNALWQISRVNGRWTNWIRLGGTLASGPAAVSWGPGRIDVVALGTDRAMWHRAFDGTRWSGWESLGGTFPANAAPDLASWGPDRLDVFARGTDSALWQTAWDGSEWSDWTNLRHSRIPSDPGAVSWGPNRIDAFARGADGQIWQLAWDGSEWSYWMAHGGQFPDGSGPDAASTGENRLEVYARGTDNAVWTRQWDGDEWSDWKSIGGRVSSDPSAVAVLDRNTAAAARYRVTLNGFTVNRETWDDALQRDGKRDEVFVIHQARLLDARGNVLTATDPMRSSVMGDANRDDWRTSRVVAGSASELGGLRTGDHFPTATPWARASAATADRMPLLLWEGELAAGRTLVVVPTIWEWDGDPDFLNRALGFFGAPIVLAGEGIGIVLSASPDTLPQQAGALAATVTRKLTGRGEIGTNVTASKNVFGDPKDRPIGMKDAGVNYVFEPQALYLDAETADLVSRTNSGRGTGVIALQYRDAEDLKGDYTLYVQIERLH